ncbi:MAG: multidrug MFS transporter [Lachnospiraceae bacterium]|nr:multidrug MFS transporter [Lachnospiraceae bacterium]
MIFVTVGTHEQQFNRLIECIDELKTSGEISDEVVVQSGFSDYVPKSCKWQKLFGYEEMSKLVSQADIIITHGGPASFIAALQVGKIPIVVPRKAAFNEHVNDHQVQFCTAVEEKYGNIILVEDISKLKETIQNYAEIVSLRTGKFESNNASFNSRFEEIVSKLIGE